jgi:hypothetical protein
MHTKDMLADALEAIGQTKMAAKARKGFYHDFLSPLDLPEIVLVHELKLIGTPSAMALRQRVINGEFDASAEEGDDWAASEEGQEVYRSLIRGR